MSFICRVFLEADMKLKYLSVLILSFGMVFSGCGSKNSEAQVEFPETIPGKIVFNTTRSQSPYSVAVYKDGKIGIVKEEGGIHPKLSPSGELLMHFVSKGINLFNLKSNDEFFISSPMPNIKVVAFSLTWLPNGSGFLAISENALGVREKIPYDLYRYDLLEKRWTKLTNFKPDEGILNFDVFKDGKRILCTYSPDYQGKERGAYVMDLKTGAMKKVWHWTGKVKIMPDEKSFLVETTIKKGDKVLSYSDILLIDIETGNEKQLTFDGNPKSAPAVSADGQWALYSVSAGGQDRIFMLHIPTGAAKEMFDRPIAYAGEVAHDRNPDWISNPSA